MTNTQPAISGWTHSANAGVSDDATHTCQVTFAADGDYTFTLETTDLAGNAAADYTQDKFTVDKTDPEVEFFDIEDKSANNGTVAPGVKYSDVNYMESGVDITIKGAKHDKTELSGNRTNIANGESIKMEDFKHDEETDDVYTMTAVIKDKAGNETEKEVMFSVNRFGSNYIFSETTEKFLDDVYANKPKDLVVTEVNVDSLVFNGISYGLDGTKKELKAGSDYTVKQSGGEGSWKEYTYTIKKENFEKFSEEVEKIAEDAKINEIIPIINIDAKIDLNEISKEMVQSLKQLEPFGEGNKTPIFAFKNLKIDSIRSLTEGKHIKMTLKDGNTIIDAIGFNLGCLADEYRIGDKIDVVGSLEINSFNGIDSLQINLKDVMKSI